MSELRRILDQAHNALEHRRFPTARQLLQRALRLAPDEPEVHDAMRSALAGLGLHSAALVHARRAAELVPDNLGVLNSLVGALIATGDPALAVPVARKMVELSPEDPACHTALLAVLIKAGMLIDCQEAGEAALERFPTMQEIMFPLASAYLEQGRAEKTSAILAQFLFDETSSHLLAGFLCTVSNYAWPTDRAAVRRRHDNFGRLTTLADFKPLYTHARPAPAPKAPINAPFPGRGRDGRLRVAFISSDLRYHSVSFFIEHLLERLDRARFQLACYNAAPFEDEVSARLRSIITRDFGENAWRRIPTRSDTDTAKQIVDDRIDVLVDLNGLTAGERCDVLRLRPAPVQVSAIGYPNTTGLATVHFRIVDAITDPPPPRGLDDAAERLVRLHPTFLCYRPPANVPPRATPPLSNAALSPDQIQRGHGIAFCSFNNLMKLTDITVELWSRILTQLPDATLILKTTALRDPRVAQATTQRFVLHNIDPARIQTLGFIDGVSHHLAAYDRAHIALDTFPYCGTTTTCEAFLMGLPVVSLAPEPPLGVHAMRVGASLLTSVGLPELIATTQDDYVRTAVDLARDRPRLDALHASLRSRLLQSPLCDEPAYAKAFGDALVDMHHSWARGDID
jgi:protein O-GlcNAc transferase